MQRLRLVIGVMGLASLVISPAHAETCADSVLPLVAQQDRIERKVRTLSNEIASATGSGALGRHGTICSLSRELVDLSNEWLSLESQAGVICPRWIQHKESRGTSNRPIFEKGLEHNLKIRSLCAQIGQ